MGVITPEGVPQSLEHTVFEEIDLTESKTVTIRLPMFPVVSGTIYNAAGEPVEQVSLRFARWNGAEAPPYCETMTGADGTYQIVIGAGVTKVKVEPPSVGLLGGCEFIESFDSSTVKDMYLPDQAKGITRVQPSVITTGEAGRIMINGINVALTKVTDASHVSLGEGISVDSVERVSDMTLYAFVTIDNNAETGARDIRIMAPGAQCVGPNLLTITAPAAATIELDNSGKTVEELVIGDGTGTELIIAKGTEVTLPSGSDSVISYKAPIINDAAETDPPEGEFTQVQRELSPSGLVFHDTVILKCQYREQDVEGIDETTLKPYFYLEEDDKGAAGDEIAVTSRDTAANTISLVIPHFSMFRLASSATTVSHYVPVQKIATQSRLMHLYAVSRWQAAMLVHIADEDAPYPVRLEMFDVQGRIVKSYLHGKIGAGKHTILLDGGSNAFRKSVSGSSIMVLTTATRKVSRKIITLQ